MSNRNNSRENIGVMDVHQYRLGSLLKEAREYLGLSQEAVADKLGIPRASVSALETGKRKVSSLELRQLARLYKRPLSHFLPDDAGSRRTGRSNDRGSVSRSQRKLD